MALIKDEIDKYRQQIATYDAGRPTTQSAEKLGNRVVPDRGPQFDASYDAKKLSQAQGRGPMPFKGFDASQDAKANAAARMPIGDNRSPIMGGTDLDKMQQNFMRFAANNQNAASIEQKAQADSRAAQPNYYLGDERSRLEQALRSNTVRKPISAPAVGASTSSPQGDAGDKADPAKNAFAGNYAADDATGQGIYTDPETKRTSIRLTGDAGDKFMQDQDKLIADGKGKAATAEDMAARRKAMGEYGGMFRQDAPKTARPGITLQSSPVEYKRNVVGAKTVGGLPAEETFSPAKTAQRDAITMTGNPLVDQRVMEDALARKQMDVMDAERASKSLLYAPGTRDYISPTLSDAQMRERQAEIAAQRIRDREDVVAGQISSAATKALDDQAKGVTSDRNLAMIPYAERRAAINNRNELMKMNSDMQQKRLAAEDSAANRADDMEKARIKDATDRYVADKNTELAQTNAQVAAQSKALDREATLKAALLKQEGVKDPIILEKLKGYNSALEAALAMPGAELTEDYLTSLQKKYGVEGLFAKSTQTDRPAPPASR